MEESLNLNFGRFGLPEKPAAQYSPLTLAFVGDAIYDLVVRTVVVRRHGESVNLLNSRCAELVKAVTQSKMVETLLPLLTEKEAEIYRRGRNANPRPWRKMLRFRITGGLRALKRCWVICT